MACLSTRFVCMYVCAYVCVHVRACVCVHVYVLSIVTGSGLMLQVLDRNSDGF